MVLLDQNRDHFLAETSVGEHPDLVSDVVPGPWSPDLLKVLSQKSSHIDNSLGNTVSELSGPVFEVAFVVEDLGSYFSSILGRAGVELSDDYSLL